MFLKGLALFKYSCHKKYKRSQTIKIQYSYSERHYTNYPQGHIPTSSPITKEISQGHFFFILRANKYNLISAQNGLPVIYMPIHQLEQ